jgi:hypothetical protein
VSPTLSTKVPHAPATTPATHQTPTGTFIRDNTQRSQTMKILMTEKKIVAKYNQTLENIDRNYLIKEKKYCIKTKFQIMTDNVKI